MELADLMRSAPAQPEPKHRHRWLRRTSLAGQIGYSYVWYRCACGARRVETQDAGGSVVSRRYVVTKKG